MKLTTCEARLCAEASSGLWCPLHFLVSGLFWVQTWTDVDSPGLTCQGRYNQIN